MPLIIGRSRRARRRLQRRVGVVAGGLSLGLVLPVVYGLSTHPVPTSASTSDTATASWTSEVVLAEARTGPGSSISAAVARTPRRITTHRNAAPQHHAFVPGPTSWSDLNAAIARIPTYRPGIARWVVGTAAGSWWGTADWYDGVIYINPSTPAVRLYDVAVHEWSHMLTVHDYGGNVDLTITALSHAFDGSGILGAERAADCMALIQGAQWVHYTWCDNSAWRAMARRLLRGNEV